MREMHPLFITFGSSVGDVILATDYVYVERSCANAILAWHVHAACQRRGGKMRLMRREHPPSPTRWPRGGCEVPLGDYT